MDDLDRAGDSLRAAPIVEPTPLDALRPRVRRRVQRRRAVVALAAVVAVGAPSIAIAEAARSDHGSVGVHTIDTADTRPPATTRPPSPTRPEARSGERVDPNDVFSMSFVDLQHGFALAAPRNDAGGAIASTSDGGAHWRVVAPTPTSGFDRVVFTTLHDGWAYGSYGRYRFVTHDGGRTWIDTRPDGDVYGLDAIGTEVWSLVSCGEGSPCVSRLERSDDGGTVWRSTPVPGLPAGSQLDVVSGNQLFVWAGAEHVAAHAIAASSDGGSTWRRVANPCGWSLAGFSAANSSDLWASCVLAVGGPLVVPKKVFRSHDGGSTWTLVASVAGDVAGKRGPSDVGLLSNRGRGADLLAVSARVAVLTAGRGGDVSVSTDGGSTWSTAIAFGDSPGIVTRLRGTDTVWVASAHSSPPDIWQATDGVHFHVIAKGTLY